MTPRTLKPTVSPIIQQAVRSVVEPLEDRRMFAVDTPFAVEWTGGETRTGVVDQSNVGTSFEFVTGAAAGVTAHDPSKLKVDVPVGVLRVTTSAGTPQDGQNTLVNNLVNAFNASGNFTVTTRLEGLTSGGVVAAPGRQAGLWFGPDQDNYVKLVLLTTQNGPRLQFIDERAVGSLTVHTATVAESLTALPADIEDLEIRMIGTTDAATGVSRLTAEYRLSDSGAWTAVAKQFTFTGALQERFFNDASRTGIIAAHRASSSAVDVAFDEFTITGTPGPGPDVGITATPTTSYFNNLLNNTTQASKTITITNTGTTVATLGTPTITGANAALYTITEPLPATLAPGASANIAVAFRPTGADNVASRGLKVAQLLVPSDVNNVTVDLRGLATSANLTSEDAEPSLQRILDLYQIPVATGDKDPDDAELYDDEEPLQASDEVAAPRLVKAGAGAVTITPLAAYAVADNVSVRLGYYRSGSPAERTPLAVVRGADARGVNATLDGTSSFDPGDTAFSLYGTFPGNALPATHFTNADGGGADYQAGGSPRDVFSEDQLNTWATVNQRNVRFYPLPGEANAYVFAMEEFPTDFDSNDFVGVIRNVTVAPAQPEIGVVDPNGMPVPNALGFNRIQTAGSSRVHDRVTLKVVNTGTEPLNITGVQATGPFTATIAGGVPSTTVTAGGSVDVEVVFTATSGSAAQLGTLTINSNDPDEAIKTYDLSGMFMDVPEGNNERPLQVVVRSLGFGTITGSKAELDTNGLPTPVGDEVVSPYWTSADGGEVTVRQLAAFHTQGTQTTMRWFTQAGAGVGQAAAPAPSGLRALSNASAATSNNMVLTWTDNTSNETGFVVQRSINGAAFTDLATVGAGVTTYTDAGLTGGTEYAYRVRATRSAPDGGDTGYSNTSQGGTVVTHLGSDAQSFYPRRAASPDRPAVGFFQPDAAFGLRIDEENSDDTLNTPAPGDATTAPHRVRFFTAKTAAGAVIPNAYIVVMDFDGINYDYNDNVYLVTNITPSTGSVAAAAAPANLSAVAQPSSTHALAGSTNVAEANAYVVQHSTDGTNWVSAGTTAQDVTDLAVVDLPPATAYPFGVLAANAAGESVDGNVASIAADIA